MSGVYVLNTKDGFRVAYSESYNDLFGSFVDRTMNYTVNIGTLNKMFGDAPIFDTEAEALDEAKRIAYVIPETDDGIMFISNYKNVTFEELLNGNANS